MVTFLENSIGEALRERAKKTPDRKAVITSTDSYSWSEIDALSDYISKDMKARGIGIGDHVGIMGINGLDWIIHFLAAAKIGAVSVLFNTRFRDNEIKHCINLTQIEHIYYSKNFEGSSYREFLTVFLHPKTTLKNIVPMDRTDNDWKNIYSEEKEKEKLTLEKVDINQTASIIFTSGTTGDSKGVELSHFSLVNNASSMKDIMGWNENDVMCVAVPLFHSFGVTGCILSMVLAGGAMLLVNSTRTMDMCKAIEKEKCTIMNGVPTMFLAMERNGERRLVDISSLKSGLIAGSQIFPQDYREIMTMFPHMNLQPSYGQTETSPCVTLCRLDDPMEIKVNTVGRPIEGVEIRTCSKGSIIPNGFNVEGEIQIKGYNVMKSYISDESSTAGVFTSDGWLRSGDLGYIREDGNLVVTGRIKNLIIRGGENISPVEIENEIKKLVGNREVKVFGVPTLVLQEDIAACIEGVGTEKEKEDILNKLQLRISDYKVPKHLFFMETMPRNSTGKINERMIKDKIIAELSGTIRGVNLKHNIM